MMTSGFPRIALAFVVAVLVALLWGAVVQTQFNLGALAGIGLEVDASLRLGTTARDIFGGFTPTYGFYVVVPALLVAFAVAEALCRAMSGSRWFWYPLGGAIGLLAAIPLVNWLAPVALLVGATRHPACTVVMAMGGALAGAAFVYLAGVYRRPVVTADDAVAR